MRVYTGCTRPDGTRGNRTIDRSEEISSRYIVGKGERTLTFHRINFFTFYENRIVQRIRIFAPTGSFLNARVIDRSFVEMKKENLKSRGIDTTRIVRRGEDERRAKFLFARVLFTRRPKHPNWIEPKQIPFRGIRAVEIQIRVGGQHPLSPEHTCAFAGLCWAGSREEYSGAEADAQGLPS